MKNGTGFENYDSRVHLHTREERQALRLGLIKAALSASVAEEFTTFDIARLAVATADAVIWILDYEASLPYEVAAARYEERHQTYSGIMRE